MERLKRRTRLVNSAIWLKIALFSLTFSNIPFKSFAQDGPWLVTQIGVSARSEREFAEKIVALLRETRLEVIDPDRAASVFEHRHSKAPVLLPPSELEKLQQAIASLSHYLALENLAEAQQSLKVLKELTPDVADYLNRKMVQAEELFQACLLTAHLLRKGGRREKAYQQIGDCVRTFPGFEPKRGDYPPHIISIFYRAAAEIDATTPATVQIRVSSGDGCRARINGVDWGPTPTKVPGIRASQVRIQVECGDRPGRIYTKQIRPGNNRFVFDARFDQVVRTEGGLLLQYSNLDESQTYRVADNSRIAEVVGAGHVLQIDLQTQTLYRIDVASKRQIASEHFKADSLAQAVHRLVTFEIPKAEEELKLNQYTFAPDDRGHDYETMAWGYTGAGLSLISLATGWIYWAVRRGERYDFLQSGEPGEYRGYEAPTLVFSALGAAGLSASMVIVLPQQPDVPWWSWLIGSGGVGLAAFGIYLWQEDEFDCLEYDADDRCIESANTDTFTGPFLALQSLPLLSVPMIYLIRHLSNDEHDSGTRDGISVSAGLGTLSLSGRF